MATKETCALASFFAACLGLFLYRFRQCAFYGPATINTVLKCLIVQSVFGSPVCKALCSIKCCDKSIRTLVPGLFFPSSPLAVVLGITERIVFSLQGMFWRWSTSHVGIKRLKRIPLSANSNTAFAVVGVLFVRRIVTSLSHPMPYFVLWRSAVSMCSPATSSTATTPSSPHGWTRDGGSLPAVANDVPVCKRWVMPDCFVYDCPLTKPLSSKIYESVIATIRIAVSHDFVPQKQVVVRSAMTLQRPGCSHFSTLSSEDKANGS